VNTFHDEMFQVLGVFVIVLAAYFWLMKPCFRPKNFPPGPINFPIGGGLPWLASCGDLLEFCKWGLDKYGKVFSFNLGNEKVVVMADFELYKELSNMDSVNHRPRKRLSYLIAYV